VYALLAFGLSLMLVPDGPFRNGAT
jgi:hypothetical protein